MGVDSYEGKVVEWVSIPAGHYQLVAYYDAGITLKKTPTRSLDILTYDNCPCTNLWGVVKSFFDNRPTYKDLGVSHRLGVLLAGKPGGGKTTMLDYVLRQSHQKLDAITVQMQSPCNGVPQLLRRLEPNRKLVFAIEDIDTFTSNKRDIILCEMMDGLTSAENMAFICTTNNREELSERLTRFGRLNKVIEVDFPSEEWRTHFYKGKLESIGRTELLDTLVEESDGFPASDMTRLLLEKVGAY